jgi:5'-3' exonuclease
MGIPFYVASLLRNNKNIQKNCTETLNIDVLGIDFNCFIHKYLNPENPVGSIIVALEHFLTHIVHAKRVLVAFDGLVPFAKIVQQRYRRFRKPEPSEGFDKHQISPGTRYMKDLAEAIRMCFPEIEISDTEEPGEGEHKIFTWVRSMEAAPESTRPCVCIYGLDADLVLISIGQRELGNILLLREKEDEGFATISVDAIVETLPLDPDEYIRMCIMSFGNDFMPPIAMFSLREDGYNRAIYYSKTSNLEKAAEEEEKTILKRHKETDRHIVAVDGHALEARVAIHLMDGVIDWEKVCYAFYKTFEWTLHYFKTSQVLDWCWYYPYPEAPLLKTLFDFPHFRDFTWEHPVPTYTIEDQLKFILPSTSLGETSQENEDELYDENSKDMRHSWMKRYKWECDPLISLPWNPSLQLTSISEISIQN